MKSDDETRADRNPTTQTADFGQIIDATPGFVWSASPDSSMEFLNQLGLAYTGFSLEQIRGWNHQASTADNSAKTPGMGVMAASQ